MPEAGDRPFDVVPGGVVLRVHVQPGARVAGPAGRHGDALKLRVAAPAVDGKANEAVLDALAALLSVRRSQVTLVAGHTSRRKRVRIDGIDADTAAAVLGAEGAL